MLFQDTRLSQFSPTHDSPKRLRALNGCGTEQPSECSPRKRLAYPQSARTHRPKKLSAVTKAIAQTAPRGVPTQLANSKLSPLPFLLIVCLLFTRLWEPRSCTFGTLAPKASSSQAASLARRHLVAVGYLPRGEYHSHACGLCLAI
jgi:hypothetical protein